MDEVVFNYFNDFENIFSYLKIFNHESAYIYELLLIENK